MWTSSGHILRDQAETFFPCSHTFPCPAFPAPGVIATGDTSLANNLHSFPHLSFGGAAERVWSPTISSLSLTLSSCAVLGWRLGQCLTNSSGLLAPFPYLSALSHPQGPCRAQVRPGPSPAFCIPHITPRRIWGVPAPPTQTHFYFCSKTYENLH